MDYYSSSSTSPLSFPLSTDINIIDDIIDNGNLFWDNFTNWNLTSSSSLLPTATTTTTTISSFNDNNDLVETLWQDIYHNNNNDPTIAMASSSTTTTANQNEQISIKNLDKWKIPQYYSLSYQMIGTLFQGIIFIVGVLGNVMVVIVVLRSRSMRTPTNCYLVSLALADTMVLLASVPNEIISYYLLGDRWIWGPFGCALFIFLQYLGINASSLSIAAFTVERYIAICHPMLAHKLCTVRRAKRIIMYVWMFATTYCAPWLFLTKTERIHYLWIDQEVYTCKFKLNREFYKGYYLTDIVLFYLLPLLISCILYALIARILYHSNDMIISTKTTSTVSTPMSNVHNQQQQIPSTTTTKQQQQQQQESPSNSNQLNQSINHHHNTTTTTTMMIGANSKKSSSSHDSSRVQVVKMLAVVVAVFATLWLPYRALVVYNSFSFPPYMELWYLMFAKTMIFVNSAINPIIYSACSMKFRREFKRMLTCGRKKRQSTNMANYRYTAGITTARHGIAMKSVAHDFGGGGGGRGDSGINESLSMTFTMGPNELSEFPATNNNKFRRTSPPSSDNLDFQTNRSNQFKQQQQQHSSTISVTICNELKSKQDETTAATSINNQSIKNQHNDNDDVPTILIGYDNHQQQQSTSIFDDNDDDNDQSTKTLRSIISRSIANGSQTMNNNNNNNNMMDDLQTIKTTTITSIAAVYSDHNHDGQFFRTETISNNNNNNDNDHQLECPEHQF